MKRLFAKSHARTPGLPSFRIGLSIFGSTLSSPVARKVICATKQNKDLSAPAAVM